MAIVHFGIKVMEKPSNRINKEWYLSSKPEHMPGWSDNHYPIQRLRAELNYDLNMQLFASLDAKTFLTYIDKKIKKFKMKACTDLNELAGTEGVYMLVLDDYKQVYIGISGDIKQRVLSHWRKWKSLERLIFGDICTSVLSVDSFGPLDTTRIYYIETASTYTAEERILRDFDTLYTLNRTAGGIGTVDTYTNTQSAAILAASANRRKKDLLQFLDVRKLQAIVSEEELNYYLNKYPALKLQLTKDENRS